MDRVDRMEIAGGTVGCPAFHNAAGQLTQWERRTTPEGGVWQRETFTYNAQGQVNEHKMKVSSASTNFVKDEYLYDTAGDGTVRQRKDNITNEAVDYTYNVLGQLIKAETTSTEWGQSFVFDGFGNLTQQVQTKGTAPSMTLSVNPANNRVTGSGISYDATGNLTSTMFGGTMSYDLANRMWSGGGMQIHYTARNERLTVNRNGQREVHMRGPGGELIGVYRIDWENGNSMYTLPVRLPEHEKVYVAGRLLFEGGRFVVTDRLGSVVYTCATGLAMQNAGFESGTANWTPYGGVQQGVPTTARSGYLSLRQTTATANAGSYQDITGLIPGRAYQFVAWVRSESGDVQAKLTVSDTAGANTVTAWGTGYDSMWWALYTTFTATAEGKARVKLEKPTTDGVLLWDDVEVMPTGDTCAKAVKLRYYPYGQEIGTVTANDRVKFGTYTRDAATGLDYAMNRYYRSTWGRFTSPDEGPAVAGLPQSWNRYVYAWSDPINLNDPDGLLPTIEGFLPKSSGYGVPDWFYWGSGSIVIGGGGRTLSPLGQLAQIVEAAENLGWATVHGPVEGGLLVTLGPTFFQAIDVAIPYPSSWPEYVIKIRVRELLGLIARHPWAIALALSAARTSSGPSLPPDPDKCPKGTNFYDATKPPHEGWKWDGGGGGVSPGAQGGWWYNSKAPGQILRPDLNHSWPKGPHWEYTDPFGKIWECDRRGNIFEKGVEWW